MSKEVRRIVFMLLALVVLMQACAPLAGQQPTAQPVKLKVLLLDFLSYAPLHIAAAEGYFVEQRLDVEFVRLQNMDEVVPLLAQGQLDVAAGPPRVSMVNTMVEGFNIKFVADKGYADPEGCAYSALMARRELVDNGELTGPAQLKGRRVDVNAVFLEGYWVEKWLGTAGLSLDDLELVEIQPNLEIEALKTGQVDCTVSSEPWVTRIVDDGSGVLWVPVAQVIPNAQFGFILYAANLLEKNRDAGKRFMVAYLKAVRQYNEGKTERNLDILTEGTGLKRELLQKCCWMPFRKDGSVDLQSFFDYQSWALAKGYAKGAVTEQQCWDGEFVEHANSVLGPAK